MQKAMSAGNSESARMPGNHGLLAGKDFKSSIKGDLQSSFFLIGRLPGFGSLGCIKD